RQGRHPPMPAHFSPTILYAEDDAAGRHNLGELLRAEGFEVWEADSGREALRQIGRGPDLVLLDINLPDLDGFEVCRRIRNDPSAATTPVLHLSGHYRDDAARIRGLEGGADAYLTKPVEPGVLVAHIHALLRAQAAEEGLRQAARDWQTTFDAVPDGVCLLDPNGAVRRCNRAMAQILRGHPESLPGRPLRELLPARMTPAGARPA